MPMKASGTGSDPRAVDRWDGGFGWIAHPEETMQRASHALVSNGDVWVVDPVDTEDLDDLLGEAGTVAGVVVLLDRHTRDAAAIARRHDVPVYLPRLLSGVARSIDAPTEVFDGELADTGYTARTVVDLPGWSEVALTDGETLVVADVLGTAEYFTAPGERLGVTPPLRLLPPRRALRDLSPERILVGHGPGVFEDATPALRDALLGARRRIPGAYLNALKAILS